MEKRFKDGFGGLDAGRFPSPVETLPIVKLPLPKAPGAGEPEKGSSGHGFTCNECSKTAKTAHGFSRHLCTHGFGVVGRYLKK